jgi:hypothetical protein
MNNPLIHFLLRLVLLLVAGLIVIASPASVVCQKNVKSKAPSRAAARRLSFRALVYADGISSSYHTYVSFDGVKVWRSGESYPSPARAREALESRLKGAVKIFKRGPVFERGRMVGQRVVAEFTADKSEKRFSVLGTYEGVLWAIETSTLRHALAFERFDNAN